MVVGVLETMFVGEGAVKESLVIDHELVAGDVEAAIEAMISSAVCVDNFDSP